MEKELDMDKIITLHAVVHGRVQGVFFRGTAKKYADSLGIVGTVANLEDGTVEIYAKGTKSNLNSFFAKLKEKPGAGVIEQIDFEELSEMGNFNSFDIV